MAVVTATTVVKGGLLIKRFWKPLLALVVIIIMFLLFLPIIIMSAFVPGGEEEDLRSYIKTGNELGISWQDLITFDMVRYNNELNGKDPNDAAMYFIELRYEEFEPSYSECAKEVEGECTEVKYISEKILFSQSGNDYKSVKKLLNAYGSKGTIKEQIDAINLSNSARIIITPRGIEETLTDGKFSEKQRKEFYDLQKSGVLQEMFPEFDGTGIIPGACINDVSPDGKSKVNATVASYTKTIKKYAEQYGIPQYVEVIKAVMMTESGGSGNDPMQASESGIASQISACVGKSGASRIGCINNPEDSIKVGVQVFKSTLETSDYDIAVAIQSYNFGPYFATWIREHGGQYTVELAEQYSQTVMASAGQGLGTPTHAQKVLSQYYIDPGCAAGTITPDMVGANEWVWPTESRRVTSIFGPRTAPCAGCSTFHKGLDLGATRAGIAGDPVWSMADGVVLSSTWFDWGGNVVTIEHGNGVQSMYEHLEKYTVKTGQKVSKGQIIGNMGNTGDSTSAHLHWQINVNGNAVNPRDLFPNVN